MQPDAVHHRPARFFYGWVIVAFGGLVVFASAPGQSFVFSVFVDEVRSETGLSRTGISTLYAAGTFASAGMVLVTSRLAARFGTRRALLAAGLCLALACFAMYGARTAVALTVVFAALRALGQGSLTINTTVMAAQWFVLKRGRAMALMGLGYPLSIAVLPPVAKALVDSVGWRETYALLGVFVLIAVIPGAILVARERPEDLGLHPDGAGQPPESESGPASAVTTPKVPPSRFWQLAVPLAIPSLLSTGLIFHQLAIMAEGGLSASLAAQLFIPHAIALATMSVFAGFLVDRLGPKVAFAVGITLLVAAMLLLSSVTVEPMAVAYSLLLGASEGTTRVVNSTVWAHYFGRTNIARLQGSAVMVVICGTALGPLPFALLSGWLGGLSEASAVLCLVALAALAAVLIYRPTASAISPHPHDDRVPLV